MIKMKYPPLFKRIPIGIDLSSDIAEIQQHYEKLWTKISKKLTSKRERELCLVALQESCMWASRGFAVSNFVPLEPVVKEEKSEVAKINADDASKVKILIKKKKI